MSECYPILSVSRISTVVVPIVGVGKERRTKIVHGDTYSTTQKYSTRYWNYLEDYWHCAGGLSVVNASGSQLRDIINPGLTRWRLAVYYIIYGRRRGKREEYRE